MSNFHRHNYAPGELDPATGPVPTFGNPGSLTNHRDTFTTNRECRAHGVKWRGDDDCWLCAGEERARVSTPEDLKQQGQDQAADHADPRVIAAIDAAIERAIASGRRFSVNDIREQFPTVTSTGLVGDRFSRMAKRRPRRMVAVDREPSNLPSTHAAEVKVWRKPFECEVSASCEPGDHTYSWPCVKAAGTGVAS